MFRGELSGEWEGDGGREAFDKVLGLHGSVGLDVFEEEFVGEMFFLVRESTGNRFDRKRVVRGTRSEDVIVGG